MRRGVLLSLTGLFFVSVSPCSVYADPFPVPALSTRAAVADPVAEAAARFDLPAAWIRAVIRAESDGDPRSTSSKGAMGLMQIMPENWVELRARLTLGSDPYDPRDNILAGAAYIREMLDRYGTPGWIAAYNAGPARYEAALKGVPLPVETRAYVATLAPIIEGGAPVGSVQMASLDPPAWTQAPLFVVSSGRVFVADPVQAERIANDGSAAASAHDISAIVPRSDGLFAAWAPGEKMQ